METLLDLADALAQESDTPKRPNFPIPDDLKAISQRTLELLERKESPSKGMGWFARQTIPAGTLLMVCKPVAMAMDWEGYDDDDNDDDDDGENDTAMEREPEDDLLEPKQNSIICLRLLQEIQKNPEIWTKSVTELFPRKESDMAQLPEIQRKNEDILSQQIESAIHELQQHPQLQNYANNISRRMPFIVRYNVLSIETLPEMLSHPGSEGHATLGGAGLYHLPSFFNHNAHPNVARWSIGDVMFFISNQDISQGAEACISYIEHDVLCESSYRRNLMLQMDFKDAGDTSDSKDDTSDNSMEDDGPDMPVVDSDVQNELMEMSAFERLDYIDELLLQAQGKAPPTDEDATEEEQGNANSTEASERPGWFQCDIQNLNILKAITLDGLGQSAKALQLWEQCIEFAETQMPPLDENSIVLRVQAALCSLHLGSDDKADVARAKEHARIALKRHGLLFGGGTATLRRRYKKDFNLSIRSSGGKGKNQMSGNAAVDFLWPLT